jgi:hypothetical protein
MATLGRPSLPLNVSLSYEDHVQNLHDHPFQLGRPDVLSLLGDPLWEMGVAHRIEYSFSYFFFNFYFIYSFYSWYKKAALLSS